MLYKANPDARAAVVKTIDKLFFEKRNKKRSHVKIFRRCIHPLYGICKATWQNYCKTPDALVEQQRLPDELLQLLRFYVLLVKYMPPAEVAKTIGRCHDEHVRAIEHLKAAHGTIKAESLRTLLRAADGEPDDNEPAGVQ